MPMSEELADCLVLNTVSAARSLLRRYDARLKPFGVTVQQFSLLGAIRSHPEEPVASLAQRISLDRTSLTRNLDLLERKGLVRRVPGASGNARFCRLTEEGDALLDQLVVAWRDAQPGLLTGLTADEIATYLKVARHLAR
ncbi:MarR family winged helix-turn-helix transcriptional regulator [Ciceribacter sp. RN22]|uniref:MarR family winged helix-turn-helix transcriptional regulator n=1 Tax=Ciceribacter sp. RN22 TaxID=2954932 RepID=UPI00209333D1|nr:MarR family transcriptional regulator [Ciceribacter sp. RN22]MCO6177664.1 MarR family transcriptional regulator [Ciceribacter sp. RN22]